MCWEVLKEPTLSLFLQKSKKSADFLINESGDLAGGTTTGKKEKGRITGLDLESIP